MKSSLTYLKNHFVCFGATVLLTLSISAAKAQVLLNVQISGDTVTITSTGTAPLTSVSLSQGYTFGDGIDLENFFQNDVTDNSISAQVATTGLTTGDASGSTGDYNYFTSDDYSTDGTVANLDLNLYNATGLSTSSTGTQTYTAHTSAFTGTLTLSLSAFGLSAADLPTGTDKGQIVAGYFDSSKGQTNPVLGTWEIVNNSVSAPEPASWIMLAAGIGSLIFWRSRRRQFPS